MEIECFKCKWFRPITGGCEAFPDDIPDDISQGLKKHNEKIKGQTGDFVFKEGKPEEIRKLEESLSDKK